MPKSDFARPKTCGECLYFVASNESCGDPGLDRYPGPHCTFKNAAPPPWCPGWQAKQPPRRVETFEAWAVKAPGTIPSIFDSKWAAETLSTVLYGNAGNVHKVRVMVEELPNA